MTRALGHKLSLVFLFVIFLPTFGYSATSASSSKMRLTAAKHWQFQEELSVLTESKFEANKRRVEELRSLLITTEVFIDVNESPIKDRQDFELIPEQMSLAVGTGYFDNLVKLAFMIATGKEPEVFLFVDINRKVTQFSKRLLAILAKEVSEDQTRKDLNVLFDEFKDSIAHKNFGLSKKDENFARAKKEGMDLLIKLLSTAGLKFQEYLRSGSIAFATLDLTADDQLSALRDVIKKFQLTVGYIYFSNIAHCSSAIPVVSFYEKWKNFLTPIATDETIVHVAKAINQDEIEYKQHFINFNDFQSSYNNPDFDFDMSSKTLTGSGVLQAFKSKLPPERYEAWHKRIYDLLKHGGTTAEINAALVNF